MARNPCPWLKLPVCHVTFGNHKLNSTTQNLVIEPAACSLVIWGFHRCQRSGWKALDSQKKVLHEALKMLLWCWSDVSAVENSYSSWGQPGFSSHELSTPGNSKLPLSPTPWGHTVFCGHLNACSKRTTSRYTHIYHIFFKIYYRSGSGGTGL